MKLCRSLWFPYIIALHSMVLTIRHWSVKPLNKGHLGGIDDAPYSEVICYNSMGQNQV